jgi:hypothetical protein
MAAEYNMGADEGCLGVAALDDADEVSPRDTPPLGKAPAAVIGGELAVIFAEPVAAIALGLAITRLCRNIQMER